MDYNQINIKYRTWFKGEKPTPIKIQVPGWGGESNYIDGQPWHCKPFVDGSTYGLELIYPFDTEVTVTTKDGKLCWTGDFTVESTNAGNWERPFSSFAPHHFGFTSSLDIETEDGYGTMILPHPRYYTDRTGTVPLAIQGMIESSWWPRIFFVVFKSPQEGQTYIFRKGEPYAQLIFVPTAVSYNIQPMTDDEKKIREEQESILSKHFKKISTRVWKNSEGGTFDNKYKRLSGLVKKYGKPAVMEFIKKIKDKNERPAKKFAYRMINVNNDNKTQQ
jgi:hypothetical protein